MRKRQFLEIPIRDFNLENIIKFLLFTCLKIEPSSENLTFLLPEKRNYFYHAFMTGQINYAVNVRLIITVAEISVELKGKESKKYGKAATSIAKKVSLIKAILL